MGCLRGKTITSTVNQPFQSVQEWSDQFLALFPHRFDYIYAPYPNPEQSPDWQTESRHPLSDRLIQQGGFLFGVRFGTKSHYCLLDIDINSIYHPKQDPLAIGRIISSLEPMGLIASVICTSSISDGLHIYFPFTEAQSSWKLALAIATLLENAGFKLLPGQLELFPNLKPYTAEGNSSLSSAHRLPMQVGSYLVNEDFQPIWSDQQRFVQQWQFAADRNLVSTQLLNQVIKQAKRHHYRISGKADKFINDLNAEIELGWTGLGQTNRLLGRITMRAYIFNHILSGGNPLEGQALIKEIVNTAKSLPGYYEWCQHTHEIEHRAEEWARCIETSNYFHYGDPKGKYKNKTESAELKPATTELPTWNQQQSESARERIRKAIAELLEHNCLPIGATARFKALTQRGIGGGSLYRHRDLWHPNYLADNNAEQKNLTSLLHTIDGNNLPDNDSSDSTSQNSAEIGGNVLPDGEIHHSDQLLQSQAPVLSSQPIQPSSNQESVQVEKGQPVQPFFPLSTMILAPDALSWEASAFDTSSKGTCRKISCLIVYCTILYLYMHTEGKGG